VDELNVKNISVQSIALFEPKRILQDSARY